jgi:hypothetical protein
MKRSFLFHGFKIVVCVALCAVLLGAVVMALWNWLIPDLFPGTSEITFLQALGLFFLGRILIGGFKGWRGGQCCGCGHKGYKGGYWRKRFEDKMSNMTPEEKEKLKQAYKKCCGFVEDESDQKG